MFRTVSYDKCHRCKGTNDRASQRTCSDCHRTIQSEFRQKKARAAKALQERVYELEDALAVALARAVAAESILAASRISRERPRETERAA